MDENDSSSPLPVAGADRLPVIALAMPQQEALCNDEGNEKKSSADTMPPVPRHKAEKDKARIDMRGFSYPLKSAPAMPFPESADNSSPSQVSRVSRQQSSFPP